MTRNDEKSCVHINHSGAIILHKLNRIAMQVQRRQSRQSLQNRQSLKAIDGIVCQQEGGEEGMLIETRESINSIRACKNEKERERESERQQTREWKR